MKNQKIYCIVGAGSIGCFIASALKKARFPVKLLIKKFLPQSECNLIVCENEQQSVFNIPVAQIESDKEKIDRVIITTKIYDVVGAIKQIRSRLAADAEILLCHNGMGVIEEVKQLLPHHNIGMLITNYGANIRAPFEVVLAGRGMFYLGYVQIVREPCLEEWLHVFTKADLNIQEEKNVEQIMWQKIVVNACINALTAIYRCKNGMLGQSQYLHYLVKQLANEATLVAEKNFIEIDTQNVFSAIEKTAENFSSTLQDVLNHRRTEIPFINGFLLKEGLKYNLFLPYQRLICQLFGSA